MATAPGVGRGSVGGSADDAGVEYRRAVAAYVAVCGLAGVPVGGLEIPDADAQVSTVILETDKAVDDIGITFVSGWTAYVQAKRSLRKGKPLNKAVGQWVEAGKSGVDPTRQRLVIASGSLNGTMRTLRDVLNRRRLKTPGHPTQSEAAILQHVIELLAPLSSDQRERVLAAAVIWELPVEEPDHASAREALAYLHNVGIPVAREDASKAWARLVAAAGKLARRRGGHDLDGWMSELRGAGLVIETIGENPAGRLETRQLVLERYAQRLSREGRELDLRILGAELPPLALDDADAEVMVRTDPEDTRTKSDLIWAFLRRCRLILTGLPGSGKSTATRRAAARLADNVLAQLRGPQTGDPGYPFPVRASLRDINGVQDGTSFRDRLITIAVRDDPAGDREILRHEIETRLENGIPIALILDGLDETYGDRAQVVAEIQNFLAGLPSVCVLIATRDIAYGQAATLGWPDLRLEPPSEINATTSAVLSAAAAHKGIDDDARAAWVTERNRWVQKVLGQDRVLSETPLVPILLAILAIERSPDQLPVRRAEVLKFVVTDFVSRRELRRQDGRVLGPLSGNSLDSAAMHAYAREAATILDNAGVASTGSVVAAIGETLTEQWQLASGHADTAALDALRFFDETGVFVISEPEQTVSPRLSLFAEIGDAVHASHHAENMPAWVSQRIAGRQLEPVILAAALDLDVSRAMQHELRGRIDDIELARAMVRAYREGAHFDDDTLRTLDERLIGSIERGTAEGWSDWPLLLDVGVPDDLTGQAIAAAAKHSGDHELLARATFALRNQDLVKLSTDPGVVLDLLTVQDLPKSPRETSGRPDITSLAVDLNLIATQRTAATVLLRHHPDAVDAVRERAITAPRGLQKSLIELLNAAGHADVATEANRQLVKGSPPQKAIDWLSDHDDSRYAHFLTLIAEADTGELSPGQKIKLDELADFAETLDLNDLGVTSLYKQPDDFLRDLIDLTVTLFGFDRSVLAAEAQVMLDRMEGDTSLDTYFAIFDSADPRTEPDWSAVSDPTAAVDLLMKLFWLSRAQARLATVWLWGSRVAADLAAPLLRDLITQLESSTRHQELAALTLSSLSSGPEPRSWVNSSNPVLRKVAAASIDVLEDGSLSPDMERLLADNDGYVREEAIARIADTPPPYIETLLNRLSRSDDPGWMCRGCKTVNPAGFRSCRKDGCMLGGPSPAATAGKLLEDVRKGKEGASGEHT